MNQLLQSQFLTAWFVDGYIVNVFGTVFKCGGGCAFTATPFSLIANCKCLSNLGKVAQGQAKHFSHMIGLYLLNTIK